MSVLALSYGVLAHAQSQTPTKVGIIHIQNAILSTKEGQKAANDLTTRLVNPKRAEIEKKQAALNALQEKYRSGSATLSDDAKLKLQRDIDQSTKELTRDTEDAQAELDQEQQKIMQNLGEKMLALLRKYANDNGFALILDVSNPQSSVLVASDGIDVTSEIVALYDKTHAAAAAPAPSGGAGAAAAPKTAPAAGAPAVAAPKTAPAAPAAAPPAAAPKKK
jgi:Skp family chaperone for outer membrane proteins